MSTRKNTIIGRVFGIGAGLSYGVSSVLIRQGVGDLTVPLVGASIAMLAGTMGLFVIGGRGLKTGVAGRKKSVLLLLASGVVSAGGVTSTYFALSQSPVTVVGPLQATPPLFALLWSWLFLGRLEKITRRLVLGSVLVVAGIILITLGGP